MKNYARKMSMFIAILLIVIAGTTCMVFAVACAEFRSRAVNEGLLQCQSHDWVCCIFKIYETFGSKYVL